MNKYVLVALAMALITLDPVYAISPTGERNINLMTLGGPESLREAAKIIYDGAGTEQEVTDVLAEVLLQKVTGSGDAYADALAWSCKALASRGKRYAGVLQQVVAASEDSHRKIRKHCENAADDVGDADGPQYEKGMVSLEKIAADAVAKVNANAAAPAVATTPGSYKPITAAAIGVSLAEAQSIVGPPTSTTQHITGKQFIPFNFVGKDGFRIIYLYKGQGRIVFSSANQFTQDMRVLEVQPNPGEPGYP